MGRFACAAAIIVAAIVGLCSPVRAEDPGLLAFGAGAYDFLHNYTAPEFRAEYRFAHGLFVFKPLVGVLGTDKGSAYVYGGLRADLVLAQHFVIMPVATVGYYNRGGGKDLGSPVEFKTGAEFAYRFDNASRLGIAFDHISNADLGRRNPGTESLMLVYSLPIAGAP